MNFENMLKMDRRLIPLRDTLLQFGCIIQDMEHPEINPYITMMITKFIQDGSASSTGVDERKQNPNKEFDKKKQTLMNNIAMREGRFADVKYNATTSDIRRGMLCGLLLDRSVIEIVGMTQHRKVDADIIREEYEVLGRPLTFGRLFMLNKQSDNTKAWGIFDKILNFFSVNVNLLDKNEIEWMSSSSWEMLHELLVQYADILSVHYECPMCGVDIEEHQKACMNCAAGNF